MKVKIWTTAHSIALGLLLGISLMTAAIWYGVPAKAQSSTGPNMFTQSSVIPWDGLPRISFTFNLPKPTSLPCTLVIIGWGDSWPTINDDAGDLWETVTAPDGHVVRGIWYAQCKGGAKTITVSFSTASRFYGVVGEKSGWYDPDVSSQAVDGNSNPSASAIITTTSADFIIGYGWNYTTTTPTLTAGTSYVMEGQSGIFLEDMQQIAPGPVSSSVNYGSGWTGWWVQGIVAFKPAIPDFCICSH